jgi:hypothetical protein
MALHHVKRQKNNRADAIEAVRRSSMRFGAARSAEQQSALTIHQVRETLVAQKLINAMRAHFAEFGVIGPQVTESCKSSLILTPGNAGILEGCGREHCIRRDQSPSTRPPAAVDLEGSASCCQTAQAA